MTTQNMNSYIYRIKRHEGKMMGPLTHTLRPRAAALTEYSNTRIVQNEKTNEKVNTWAAVENATNGYPWDGNETSTSIEDSDTQTRRR